MVWNVVGDVYRARHKSPSAIECEDVAKEFQFEYPELVAQEVSGDRMELACCGIGWVGHPGMCPPSIRCSYCDTEFGHTRICGRVEPAEKIAVAADRQNSPTPWMFRFDADGDHAIMDANGKLVAVTVGADDLPLVVDEGNARLIVDSVNAVTTAKSS